jgi:predicted flavoprotein YhiN
MSGGGVLLSELKRNFESKKVPGLYFIGEACDVVGKT